MEEMLAICMEWCQVAALDVVTEIFQAFLETLIGLLDGLKVSCQETKAQDDRDILIRFDKT